MASSESQLAKATRRSIQKLYPIPTGAIMSRGTNPLTVHCVDDCVFAGVWSLIYETMFVRTALSRETKESIATLVVDQTGHPLSVDQKEALKDPPTRLSSQVAKKERNVHIRAMAHAGNLLRAMVNLKADDDSSTVASSNTCTESSRSGKSESRNGERVSSHTEMARAEAALVIVLFTHLNRVSNALLGEEVHPELFSGQAPAGGGFANRLTSFFLARTGCTNRTKYEAGMTTSLHAEEVVASFSPLPQNLVGVLLSGHERAIALARMCDWESTFRKETLIKRSIMSKRLLNFLEYPSTRPPSHRFSSAESVVDWVDTALQDKLDSMRYLSETNKAIGKILVLTTYAPKMVPHSIHWRRLVDCVGESMARSIVVWWSLRSALRDAKGLDREIDAKTMLQVLSQ
ncbi:expressed unknown protein [Seminavis robusta]|uniref:Uncharacterized protein n=1 Tax=Seminavis robusta TaxID=568900 RepID=A0A9N8HGX3_9STRA|nr:expressed unknown protein [Seminavis robusta]|eukprot:Sro419_g139020.1 n/a (403) ;mRNA; r:18943-20151